MPRELIYILISSFSSSASSANKDPTTLVDTFYQCNFDKLKFVFITSKSMKLPMKTILFNSKYEDKSINSYFDILNFMRF